MRGLAATVFALSAATPLAATELSSPGFRHLGGSFDAVAASELSAPGPRYSSSGGSLGQPGPVGFSGSDSDLTTAASGFWPLVAGAFPSLDVDGDGIASYEDDDDDGDGLLDGVETDTGVFVSGDDTGTSPVVADSDGDGFDDGPEVAAGSDPNDPASTPSAVPALPPPAAGLLALALLAAARRALRPQE